MIKYLKFIGTSLILSSFMTTGVFAQEVQGQIVVTYNSLIPAHVEGNLCEDDLKCQEFENTCQELYGSMMNSRAEINYDIIPEMAYHNAVYTYDGVNVKMSAMGISGKYAFISNKIPEELRTKYNIKNIFFIIEKDFKKFNSHFIFKTDQKFQCILSGITTAP